MSTYYSWLTVSLLSAPSAAQESKDKGQVEAELAEGNSRRWDLQAGQGSILSLGTVWEQNVQSVHGQEQITLAQCSKLCFILKPVTSASENKWQVYLH